MKKRISALLLAMLCLMMNECLSMSNEAKADLDKELAQMIGETGTKVPGLGVIAFKDGKFYEDGAHFAPQGKAPGKYFSYSNLNYGILGTIIEKATGERFDKYQKNHILKQLDIKGYYLPSNFSKKEFAKLGAVYQKKDADGVWNENGRKIQQQLHLAGNSRQRHLPQCICPLISMPLYTSNELIYTNVFFMFF